MLMEATKLDKYSKKVWASLSKLHKDRITLPSQCSTANVIAATHMIARAIAVQASRHGEALSL